MVSSCAGVLSRISNYLYDINEGQNVGAQTFNFETRHITRVVDWWHEWITGKV